jgi:hypothetical protein
MRLGLAHELGFALSMTAACVIVLLGGEVPIFAWLVVAAPWVSFFLAMKGRAAPSSSGTALATVSIGLGIVLIVERGVESAVLGGGVALLGLLAARLLTRETAAHDMQAVLLSLLLIVAGSVLNVGINYVLVFVVYAVTTVWALATRQLLTGAQGEDSARASASVIRARSDIVTPMFFVVTGGISLAVLLSTTLVFVAFPRVGFGDLGIFAGKGNRLPGQVDLRGGALGSAGGTDVIARVRGVSRMSFVRGLYLRGAVYDVVTEQGFEQSAVPPQVDPQRLAVAPGREEGRYEIAVQPVVGTTLFSLGSVVTARALAGGRANPNFPVSIDGQNARTELVASSALTSPLRYEVIGGVSAPGFIPPPGSRRPARAFDPSNRPDSAYLRVPDTIDPRIVKLAAEIVADATEPKAKVEKLSAFLLQGFTYTRDQPNGGEVFPLRTFLLTDRRGHCEYFATALALLLRLQGVPARVIGGFQGGAWDEEERIVVFQSRHAHAWVEWYLPGVGWIVDDATPLADGEREDLHGFAALMDRVRRLWDDRVLDYALSDQAEMIQSARSMVKNREEIDSAALGRSLLAGLAILVVGVVMIALLRRRQKTRGHVLARAIEKAIERVSGTPVVDTLTLREAAARVEGPPRAAILHALARYEADRFADVPLDPTESRELVRSLSRVQAR